MDGNEIAHAICDLDGRFVEVDDTFGDLLQLTFGDILSRNVLDVTFADDREPNSDLLRDLVEHGQAFTIRKRYVRPDGSLIWVRNHVSRVIGARGRVRLSACIRALPPGESEIATNLEQAARRARRQVQAIEDRSRNGSRTGPAERRRTAYDDR